MNTLVTRTIIIEHVIIVIYTDVDDMSVCEGCLTVYSENINSQKNDSSKYNKRKTIMKTILDTNMFDWTNESLPSPLCSSKFISNLTSERKGRGMKDRDKSTHSC